MPILSRHLPRRKPGVFTSTMNSETPLEPSPLSVFATTSTMSQVWPLEMKVLAPLMTYLSPFLTARVRTDCRSEPVPGSVMATAQMHSPEPTFGSQNSFCSSVPSSRMYLATMWLRPVPRPPPLPASTWLTQT
ncbi:hypothetical protein D3C78_1420370 [compost metagenome]